MSPSQSHLPSESWSLTRLELFAAAFGASVGATLASMFSGKGEHAILMPIAGAIQGGAYCGMLAYLLRRMCSRTFWISDLLCLTLFVALTIGLFIQLRRESDTFVRQPLTIANPTVHDLAERRRIITETMQAWAQTLRIEARSGGTYYSEGLSGLGGPENWHLRLTVDQIVDRRRTLVVNTTVRGSANADDGTIEPLIFESALGTPEAEFLLEKLSEVATRHGWDFRVAAKRDDNTEDTENT